MKIIIHLIPVYRDEILILKINKKVILLLFLLLLHQLNKKLIKI